MARPPYLRESLDRARREPSTQLVSVIGEPGIGKTRLVEGLLEYVEELPEFITWRRGRSLAYGEGVAFWALGEMVKAQAGILESDAAAVAREKLSEAVAAVILDERDRVWVARHLRPLIGLERRPTVVMVAGWRRLRRGAGSSKRWPSRVPPCWCSRTSTGQMRGCSISLTCCRSGRCGAAVDRLYCSTRAAGAAVGWGGGKSNAHPSRPADGRRRTPGSAGCSTRPASRRGSASTARTGGGEPVYVHEYVRMLLDRAAVSATAAAGGWRMHPGSCLSR